MHTTTPYLDLLTFQSLSSGGPFSLLLHRLGEPGLHSKLKADICCRADLSRSSAGTLNLGKLLVTSFRVPHEELPHSNCLSELKQGGMLYLIPHPGLQLPHPLVLSVDFRHSRYRR